MPRFRHHAVLSHSNSITRDPARSPVKRTTFDAHVWKPRPSLFDRLPVELHVEIFGHCLSSFPQFDNDEPPLVITRVCGAWRALVLATPKLWSSFEIEVQGSGNGPSNLLSDVQIMSTMSVWLQRSKNYPLSVRIIHHPIGRIRDNLSAELIAILISQARRWRHVEFIVPTGSLSAMQNALPDGFPMLKSLTLHLRGLWNSAVFDIRTVKIPWAQLISLDLRLDHSSLLNLDDCLDILSEATSLVTCSLNANCMLTLRGADRDALVLPSLRDFHLTLQGTGSDAAVQPGAFEPPERSLISFLNIVSGAKLQSLSLNWLVEWNGGTRDWCRTHPGFFSFLRSQSHSLRSIKLAYLPLGEAELMLCTQHLPHLEDLDLRFSLADHDNDPITDSLLKTLTAASTVPSESKRGHPQRTVQPPLLPSLKSLHIHCTGELCSHHTVLDFIHSRVYPMHRKDLAVFTSFHWFSMRPVSESTQKRVKQWTSSGFDITVENLEIL